MSGFFSSPYFLYVAVATALSFVLVSLLRSSVVWAPRGITPPSLVKKLKSGGPSFGWIPKTLVKVWGFGRRNLKGLLIAATGVWVVWTISQGDAWLPQQWLHRMPDFLTIRDWSWKRLLVLVMAAGGIILIFENTLSKDGAKKGRGIVLGILAFLLVLSAVASTSFGSAILRFLGVPAAYLKTETAAGEDAMMAARIPLASGPDAKMAQVVMAAYGMSIRFPVLKLTRPIVKGSGFEVHCLYQPDGADKVSSLPDRCPEDPGVYEMYLVDTSGKANYPWYGYELK